MMTINPFLLQTQACETYNFLLGDNRLVYAGFFPQNDLVDQNYGLRKAIAHSQLYEKDEEYMKTDMLNDTYEVLLKARREQKLIRSTSPLDIDRSGRERPNDESQVQSLTGTGSMEKRTSMTNRRDKGTTEKSS